MPTDRSRKTHSRRIHISDETVLSVKSTRKNISFIILFFVAIMLLVTIIPMFDNIANYNKDITDLKTKYNYYQDIITYAEQNPENIIIGQVEYAFECEYQGKWGVFYSFQNKHGLYEYGRTYSIYTYSQTQAMNTIKLASRLRPDSNVLDTINMDFKNYEFEKMGEYLDIKTNINANICSIIFCVITGIACLIVGIFLLIKFKKQPIPKPIVVVQKDTKQKYCSYCGTYLDDNNSCPSCGATQFEMK